MNSQDKNQGAQNQQQTLKAQDFRNLVRNQGRTKVGNTEFCLNSQDQNNPNLQAIVNDSQFTIRSTGDSKNQRSHTYELKGAGKTLSVNVDVKSANNQQR